MADDLLPIEDQLRSGEFLDLDAHLVLRGWPVNIAGIMRNADLTQRRYSLGGEPFVAISAEVTIPGWDLDSILQGPRLRSRRTYAIVAVSQLVDARFDLLPTFKAPHYSIRLPSYTEATAARLVEVLGDEKPNPYHERREP